MWIKALGASTHLIATFSFLLCFAAAFGCFLRNQNFCGFFLLIWSNLTRSDLVHLICELIIIVDFLLEKLHKNYDLTRVKSIGGAAQVRNEFTIK